MRMRVKVINTRGDLALITDGERRYGPVLFELCSELVRTGKRGRPPRTLLKGIQVRISYHPHSGWYEEALPGRAISGEGPIGAI